MPLYALKNGTQLEMVLDPRFRAEGHYQICPCGAWNHHGDGWFEKAFGNHCYMCLRPIFVLPEVLEQAKALETLC